jgi:ATP-binding cassette subfamily B (MDR/TAP) protein 1
MLRYGCRLVAFNETSMYNFFVAFMGVFFSGQATSQMFQFSTSPYPLVSQT